MHGVFRLLLGRYLEVQIDWIKQASKVIGLWADFQTVGPPYSLLLGSREAFVNGVAGKVTVATLAAGTLLSL